MLMKFIESTLKICFLLPGKSNFLILKKNSRADLGDFSYWKVFERSRTLDFVLFQTVICWLPLILTPKHSLSHQSMNLLNQIVINSVSLLQRFFPYLSCLWPCLFQYLLSNCDFHLKLRWENILINILIHLQVHENTCLRFEILFISRRRQSFWKENV